MSFDLRLDGVYRHSSRDIDGHLGGCLCVYTPLEGVDAIDGPMAGHQDVLCRLRGRVGPLPQLLRDLRRFPWPARVGCRRSLLDGCGVVPAPARRLRGRERQPGRRDRPDQPSRLAPGQGQVRLDGATTLGNQFARAFMSAGKELHGEKERRERSRARVQRYVVPTRTLYYRVRRPTTAWPDSSGASWAIGPGLQRVGPSEAREPGIGKAGASREPARASQECSPPQSRLEVGP
jgi:hypothetical protein